MKKLIFMFFIVLFASPVSAQLISKSSVNLVGVQEVTGVQVGSIADLVVEVHNGSGRVFVDTMPLTEIDTQTSARLASQVSCSFLNIDCSGYDFFYIIRSNSPLIGGPSAGGSMALATLLALTNQSMLDGIVMTGTINPDGTIGPVSGILAKAEAVYRAGFKTFLIPPTQSVVYMSNLESLNLTGYASTNWGLDVVEVSSLGDVFERFTGFRVDRSDYEDVELVTEEYNGIMSVLASALLSRLELLNSDLHYEILEANLSYSSEQEVELAVNTSDSAVLTISQLFADERYYVTASRALQESMNTLYASYIIGYDSAVSKSVFVKSVLENVEAEISVFVNTTDYSLVLDDVYDLELVVASLDRLREAESIISSAFDTYYSGDYRGALFLAATASERLETARVWINNTGKLSGNSSIAFNISKLSELASSAISDARIAITYASTVASDAVISSLDRSLEEVTDFFIEGKYARTIFESLSLIAESNLLMEIRGLDDDLLNSLFSVKRDNVVRLISIELASDNLPILAVSYLLYSDYFFETGDLSNALRYLNYAAQYSSLSANVFRAVTGEEIVVENSGYSLVKSDGGGESYAMFFLGFVTAAIIFVLAVTFRLIVF